MPARHAPLALLAALALACSLRPYTGESGTGTSSSSSGDTPPTATGTSSTSATTTAPATSTGGPVAGTWRGYYGIGTGGRPIFSDLFVDCETGKTYTLHGDLIAPACELLKPESGTFLRIEGVLQSDGGDEDLLGEIEVTAILEGPCESGTCEESLAWSECGTWVDVCGCDPIVQNCPGGEKCVPYSSDGVNSWDALGCVPVMPGAGGTGDPCMGDDLTGIDTCAKGHVCWNSAAEEDPVCVPQCTGTYDVPECPACSSCTISGDGILTLCLGGCSPLSDECGDTSVCVPAQHDPMSFVCPPDASGDGGQVFDPCTDFNTCDNGLWCAPPAHASECDPQAPGCCLPFCDMTQPTCPGAAQVCVPWYDPDAPPTCDADLGHCRLP